MTEQAKEQLEEICRQLQLTGREEAQEWAIDFAYQFAVQTGPVRVAFRNLMLAVLYMRDASAGMLTDYIADERK